MPARAFVLPAIAGLLAGGPTVRAADPDPAQRVVVIGTRQSLQSAQAHKRDDASIVDSVVAADIARLPDVSASDAVQRVTGVQIVRDRGEGSVVSVRGLTQVETTLNGREVFTAGTGRTLDFADIAAEMLAAIDVYKSSAAHRVEGGLGGTIDLRTRRPFDFAGDALALGARAVHGELVDRGAAQASALVSRRLRLGAEGELGWLLNVALQDRAWREDQKSAGNPLQRSDLVPGQTVLAPNGTSETVSAGRRRRAAASAVLQWRPSAQLELLAEAHFARLETKQDSHQINVTAGTGFVPGSVTLFPGTTDLRGITWTDAPFSVLSFARDTLDRTRQFALGARWDAAPLTLSADLSYTKSFNHLFFSGPFFGGRVAQFSHDLAGRLPSTTVAGTDLLNPAALTYTGLAYRTRPFAGDLTAARVDAQWALDAGPVERLAIGWRHAMRRADNEPGLVFADAPLSGPSAADTPERVRPIPYGGFFGGRGSHIGPFLVGDLGGARDAIGLREAFGVTQPLPEGGSPLQRWRIDERSDAAYGQLDMQWLDGALTGQAGLRAVRTRAEVRGAQTVQGSGTIEPIEDSSRQTDWLPSASLRHRFAPGLQWRAAASRTVTRVDFDRLSPSLTLVPNPVNPALNQGSAGNPALRPVRARNLDLALEAYPSAAHSASLTLFWKQVDGFIANFSQPEVHDGATYQVSRPYNSDPAHVRGVELSHQRFLDFLPGAWRGLGWQVNYTRVDSRAFDRRAQRELPLQNLSRDSGNLVALYEHADFAARLAYNRRSRFLSGVSSIVGVGAVPAYTRGYGWLDASVDWRLSPQLSLTLEGSNLTRTLRSSYFGLPTRPQSALVNDRQFALRLSARL
jgi:iron complex outermembrane receptor protein